VQHLISFGAVNSCRIAEAQRTRAATPKWVKTISIKPLLGEWQRATAWYGHLTALNEVPMKCFGGAVSFSTCHDVAQRTSYVHYSDKPITAFFTAPSQSTTPYIATPEKRGTSVTVSKPLAQYLKAKDDGQQ
jgi:hypothetical protein